MYTVEIKEKKGTCDNSLFELMAKNGDITATKLSEVLGQEVEIVGYSKCEITTDDNKFNMNYFDTKELGLISSASEIFLESVETYFEKVKKVRLTEVKTKKGKTYKAQPILEQTTNNKEEETENDLPF